MHILRMTRSASKYIERESKKCPCETGGLLIGTLQQPCVMKASKAGRGATKTPGSYTNDALHDNRIMQRILNRSNGKLKLVGYWHKHPGTMSSPSAIDLAAAQDIVAKNDPFDRRPVFFVVTNVIGGKAKTYGYCLNPSQRNFIRTKIEIIKNNSKEFKRALRLEPIVIIPRELSYWCDFDFQFYRTKVGEKRLKDEMDLLIAQGYGVRAFAKDHLRLVIAKEETIVCIPPPEYPLNPPRFFKKDAEIEYSMPLWNTSFRIIDIVKRIERQGERHESHSTRTRNKTVETIRHIKNAVESIWSHKRKRRSVLRSQYRHETSLFAGHWSDKK